MPSTARSAIGSATTREAHVGRAASAVIALAALLFAGLTAWLALRRFATFHNETYDLALYARMAWGLAHGQAWDPILGGSLLGGTRPLVLLPLGLVGAVFGTVPTLLVAQALALAGAAWPVARFAARRLGPIGALAGAFAWLLYPTLGHVATYEFHPGSLALVPLCFAFDSLDRERPRALLGWGALALACRAPLALELVCIGVLALARPALRRAAVGLIVGSLVYLALGALAPMPEVAGQSSLALHFGKWGGSPLGVLAALFAHPTQVFAHFTAPARLDYPLRVLAPLAFLPLLGFRWLLPALPALALNLVSEFPTAVGLYSHYLTPALPALMFAALAGLARARELAPRASPALAAPVLVAAALAGSLVAGGLPWSRDFAPGDFARDAATRARRAVLAHIPSGASVQAPDPLLPHLAERAFVHRVPPPERGSEYVVLDVSHRRRYAHREDLLRTREEPVTRRWLARADHGLAFARGDYLVLERGGRPRAGRARRYFLGLSPPDIGTPLCRCLALLDAELIGKTLSLSLVARRPCPSDLAIRLGAGSRPERVDLLFAGLLSPAQLDRGDRVRSEHRLSAGEIAAIEDRGLSVGVLRSSGARPEPGDPIAIRVRPSRWEPRYKNRPGKKLAGGS